jgi:hypothetical protein
MKASTSHDEVPSYQSSAGKYCIKDIDQDQIEPQKKNNEDSDFDKEKAETQKFIDFNGLDIKGLSNIFDKYATKKTYATGAFNLALIATNFTQLKQILTASASLNTMSVTNAVVLACICVSLILQLVLIFVLVILAKHGEFYDEEKREQLIRGNNAVTLIVLTVSILNVFINVFLNV